MAKYIKGVFSLKGLYLEKDKSVTNISASYFLSKRHMIPVSLSGKHQHKLLKKLLKHYVQEELDHPDRVQPSQVNRTYFARNRVISNHIHKALVQGRSTKL